FALLARAAQRAMGRFRGGRGVGDRALRGLRRGEAGDANLRLGQLGLRPHALELIVLRLVSLERTLAVGALGSEWTREPIAVSQPQLAPLVRRLDVVVINEALLEPTPRVVRLTDRGRAQRQHAVGGGLLVAVA